MQTAPGLLGILGTFFGYVFPFWPTLLLLPLAIGGRNLLKPMLALWVFFLIGWLILRAAAAPYAIQIIPEPLNSTIFFITGAVLTGVFVIRLIQGLEP